MNKIILFLVALCLIAPLSMKAQNKTLDKAMKKEYQTKMKEYKKEGWKLFGSSRSLDIALLTHYDKLNTLNEDGREVVGVASKFKSKNVGHQIAINSACITYAQQAGSHLKGRVVSDMSGDGVEADEEFDHFYAAYERLVEKEIKGEMRESYSIIRENGDGTFEMQTFFIINESAASKARIRALENAAKESAVARKFYYAFRNCQHIFGAAQNDGGVGAVAGAQCHVRVDLERSFQLECIGAARFIALWRYVFYYGVRFGVGYRSDGYCHRHSDRQLADLSFVDIAFEYKIGHVGDGGYSGAVVECVGLDHRAADFHRHVEYQAVDCRADHSVAFRRIETRHTVAHDVEGVFSAFEVADGTVVGRCRGLIFFAGYEFALVECLGAFVFVSGVIECDFRGVDSCLSR